MKCQEKSPKEDIFIMWSFNYSKKSPHTIKTYKTWIARVCQETSSSHPLDIPPQAILSWYANKTTHFAPSSLAVIRAALKYFYGTLMRDLQQLSSKQCSQYELLFDGKIRHAYTLPKSISHKAILRFLDHAKLTRQYSIFYHMYQTGRTAQQVMDDLHLHYSLPYLQQVCAKIARHVNIPQGFGLRGLRASGIIHAIQSRRNDHELVAIFRQTGISWDAFHRYCQAAGNVHHPPLIKIP